MTKRFNVTGVCFSDEHYMADISAKLEQTIQMVEYGDYFIINRPRQYGKTTTLYSLADILQKTGKYLVFNISFEGIGDVIFEEETVFAPRFFSILSRGSKKLPSKLRKWMQETEQTIQNFETLSNAITTLTAKTSKKIVVLIDEVDKSSNNQLFVSFLAMLRNMYLERRNKKTFHSVVLAGVHDVKSLKIKIRGGAEQKFNSPWNIAAEYKVDMNLYPHEIKPMLEDYVAETGVQMDTQKMADLLFYYTSGYPFLVSKLCKMMAEEVMPIKEVKEWTRLDFEWVVRQLILEKNTNSESVTTNLENNADLYDIVYKMLVDGEYLDYNIHDPNISLGLMFGIFKNDRGIKIHNRIYEELIYHYMTTRTKRRLLLAEYTISKDFKIRDNALNMELVMLKFQAFMRDQYSKKDRDFLERHGRLVFLAFLKPILNGHGYDFKEVQISQERRLDVTITFYQHKYVAELKIWRGQVAHEEGLDQLADYLDKLDLTEGYLLIFDHNEIKSWQTDWVTHNGKRIFVVWV